MLILSFIQGAFIQNLAEASGDFCFCGGFTRTHIPVKNIYETYPVSRSQAKRLCHRFEKFEEIELDFNGIDEIGQGFAHEIFVVFQNNHPNVKLIPVNVSEDVRKMISHVKKTD